MENLNLHDDPFCRRFIFPWMALADKGVRSTVVEGVDSVDHQLEKTVSKVRARVQDRNTGGRPATWEDGGRQQYSHEKATQGKTITSAFAEIETTQALASSFSSGKTWNTALIWLVPALLKVKWGGNIFPVVLPNERAKQKMSQLKGSETKAFSPSFQIKCSLPAQVLQ